jgi:hypothetical protein
VFGLRHVRCCCLIIETNAYNNQKHSEAHSLFSCTLISHLHYVYSTESESYQSIMEAIAKQIRDLHASADVNQRQHLQEQLRDLQRELSTPFDLIWGMASAVS